MYCNKPQFVSSAPWEEDVIHYHLLESSNKPLILCEGSDDEKFASSYQF